MSDPARRQRARSATIPAWPRLPVVSSRFAQQHRHFDGRETWVCYEHRRTSKVKPYRHEPRCPDCGQPIVNLGKKARIPKSDDRKGCEALREHYRRQKHR